MIRGIKRYLEMHGCDPIRFAKALFYWPRFIKDMRVYKAAPDGGFPLEAKNLYPVLCDYKEEAGIIKGHYVHQDLWAARKVYQANPKRHVDIASRIDGFITSLLVFRAVEIIDVRPLKSPYPEMKFIQDNAVEMNGFADGELESVSCLHAVEHFGLGRYGDPIDPQGVAKFAQSLTRVIKRGGKLYLSTPIGRQRVQFNAHRVFAPGTILELFSGFKLLSFSAVNDTGDFVPDAKPDDFKEAEFSCGMFEFERV